MIGLLTALLFLLSTGVVESASNNNYCPNGWSFSNETSYCYYVSQQYLSLDEAINYCTSIGGTQVQIKSTTEKNYLATYTANLLVQPWIGMRRNTTNGVFYGLDGTTGLSTWWTTGEPGVNGDCVTFKATDTNGMKVTQCYSIQPALCKQQPALCPTQTQYGGLSTRSGTISSPGYPVQYYNNLRCTYTITSPPNTYITMDFDPYVVEDFYDWIEVFDGNSTAAPYLGYIDLWWWRDDFESTNNSITFYFYTDEIYTDRGWLLTWSAKDNSPPIRQTGTNGTMTSPHYPSNYDPYTEQMYYISVATGFQVNVTIDTFLTEATYDVLEVYNSTYLSSYSLVANLSGSAVAPWSYVSPYSYVTLRFKTDSMIQKSGWHLNWFRV